MNKVKLIMLIDDDSATNFYHQIIIEEINCTEKLLIYQEAHQALSYLGDTSNEVPDIIFLDINMPLLNGWEFLDAYKKIITHRNLNTKIIILTTSLNGADKQRSKEYAEVFQLSIKPLSEKILLEILEVIPN